MSLCPILFEVIGVILTILVIGCCACGCLMILCHAEVYITNTFALRGNNVNKIDVRKNSIHST